MDATTSLFSIDIILWFYRAGMYGGKEKCTWYVFIVAAFTMFLIA